MSFGTAFALFAFVFSIACLILGLNGIGAAGYWLVLYSYNVGWSGERLLGGTS